MLKLFSIVALILVSLSGRAQTPFPPSVVWVDTNHTFFIDLYSQGPLNSITGVNSNLTSYGDFKNIFGDDVNVKSFFDNGGGYATMVRTDNLLTGLDVIRGAGLYPRIIVLPSLRRFEESYAKQVRAKAAAIAKEKKAMLLLDTPQNLTVSQAIEWRDNATELSGQSNVAIYYPDVVLVDPATNANVFAGMSASLAGAYTQRDMNFGFWISPGNFSLIGVNQAQYNLNMNDVALLTEASNGVSINPLMYQNGRGYLIWGARTADSLGTLKYISNKRTTDFISESIKVALQPYRYSPSTQAALDSVNDMLERFISTMWTQGVIFGASAQEAGSVSSSFISANVMRVKFSAIISIDGPTTFTFDQVTDGN